MQSLGAAVMLSGSSLPDVKLLVHESFLENLDHKSLVRQELTWVLPYSHAVIDAVIASFQHICL